MRLPLTSVFLLIFVNEITAQPLDWGTEVTVFGSSQEEYHPCLAVVSVGVLHAFCRVGEDSLAVKRSGIGGQAWSAVNKRVIPFVDTEITCAQDNSYSYLIAYSTQSALKQLFRFDLPADQWNEAQFTDIPTGFGSNVDVFAAVTDRVAQPGDPFLNMCWIEGVDEGSMSIGFIQSRDQGNSLEPTSLVHSTSAVPEAPAGLAIAVTWGVESEAIHIGATRDRAGAVPDEVVLFRSSDQGVSWSDPVTVDASTYEQREPALAGYAFTLFLAYARRSDVTVQRDIYCVYSLDGGTTFSEPMILTASNLDEFSPRVAVDHDGANFHVFYLACEVQTDTSTLTVRSGSVAEPWDVGEALPISETGAVRNQGGYSVASGPAGVAAVWTTGFALGDQDVVFDASWRGTNIGDRQTPFPHEISLGPCYPNPFNSTTTIPIQWPSVRTVELAVFDALGRRVEAISLGTLPPGEHHVMLDFARHATGNYWINVNGSSSPPVRVTLLR